MVAQRFEPREGSDWREPGHSAAAALTPSGTVGTTSECRLAQQRCCNLGVFGCETPVCRESSLPARTLQDPVPDGAVAQTHRPAPGSLGHLGDSTGTTVRGRPKLEKEPRAHWGSSLGRAAL